MGSSWWTGALAPLVPISLSCASNMAAFQRTFIENQFKRAIMKERLLCRLTVNVLMTKVIVYVFNI